MVISRYFATSSAPLRVERGSFPSCAWNSLPRVSAGARPRPYVNRMICRRFCTSSEAQPAPNSQSVRSFFQPSAQALKAQFARVALDIAQGLLDTHPIATLGRRIRSIHARLGLAHCFCKPNLTHDLHHLFVLLQSQRHPVRSVPKPHTTRERRHPHSSASAPITAWHPLERHVRPTLEIIVTESPTHLCKTKDEESGLALISARKLDAKPISGQAKDFSQCACAARSYRRGYARHSHRNHRAPGGWWSACRSGCQPRHW
jgi:hypothetical protein